MMPNGNFTPPEASALALPEKLRDFVCPGRLALCNQSRARWLRPSVATATSAAPRRSRSGSPSTATLRAILISD
jgi:hypothetical protein